MKRKVIEFALVEIGRRFKADGKEYRKTREHFATDGWREDYFGNWETVELL